ncbi:uncharacterized protein LOC121260189 [Juglans microcarpa x Juglans regia]|uniref:uncharacterized protein LOC121260189 n=1 Tax=Juglans microcarpa x Juglans regia TaxID=2249226 RepID=UPI001B7F2BC8|nr:uncharacterized protein LOC121260189 [Juglans microcarpa x Juglans regia]
MLQKSTLRAVSFKEIFEQLNAQCETETMELFAMTARGIWQRRNKSVFEGSFLHPNLISQNAAQQLEEYKAAQLGSNSTTRRNPIQAVIWSPPPTGIIKVNWDAALWEDQDKLGIGLVARDHEGRIIASKKVAKAGCVIPLLAEAIGAYQGVKLASEMNLESVIFEGDSLQVVQAINLHKERWDNVGLVLDDTRMLLAQVVHWQFNFVKRNGNELAHCLAKKALELTVETSEMVVIPNCNEIPPM